MTYFILAVFKDMLSNLNRTDPTWTQRITGSGVICVKNINFASRPYMYFSEQGNVDDDGTFVTIFFVSFNLQSCYLMQSAVCGLQSAVCSLQMSYTDLGIHLRKIHIIAVKIEPPFISQQERS